MRVHTVLLLISVITWIKLGKALECYHCHQTSAECINGVKKHLQSINCTDSKCFVLKYESKKNNRHVLFTAEMPGVTVLAAYRGCYYIAVDEILETVKTDKHKVTIKHFHLCNYTLCNSASKLRHPMLYFVCAVIFLLVS